MEEKKQEIQKQSKIVVCNQSDISISGISKVISSTEKLISVVINEKVVAIEGENLTVSELNVETGVLMASGKIVSIKYTTEKQKDSLIKRIFGWCCMKLCCKEKFFFAVYILE